MRRVATALGTILAAIVTVTAAADRSVTIVQAPDAPVRLTRATILSAMDGPPVVLYAAENPADAAVDEFTVIAFIFDAGGTLKARQTAPGRRGLEPHTTKYSTLVLDGSPVAPTDVVVIGINQVQAVGSSTWWRANLQSAAEAAVAGPAPKR